MTLFTTKSCGIGPAPLLVKKVMVERGGAVAIDAPYSVGTTVILSFAVAVAGTESGSQERVLRLEAKADFADAAEI